MSKSEKIADEKKQNSLEHKCLASNIAATYFYKLLRKKTMRLQNI